MRNGRWKAAGIAAVLLLAGCASGPTILVNEDPAADLRTFRTFGFASPLGTDREEYSSLLSQFLRNATTRELEARGYRLDQNDPDMVVNFYVETRERFRSTSTPSPYFGYYGYRWGHYGVWNGYETTVTQYTEGTLNVDIVDPERKQLVWEATVVGRVRDEHRENLQTSVDRVIDQVFDRFPYVSGSYVPESAASTTN